MYRKLKQYSENIQGFLHEETVMYIVLTYCCISIIQWYYLGIYQQKLQYQPKLTTNTSQNTSTVKLLFSVLETHCFNFYWKSTEKTDFKSLKNSPTFFEVKSSNIHPSERWICQIIKKTSVICMEHLMDFFPESYSWFFHFPFQKQAMLVRQLEEEVVKTRQHAKETNPEIKAHIESLQLENDHLTREVAILKETIKVRILRFICIFLF